MSSGGTSLIAITQFWEHYIQSSTFSEDNENTRLRAQKFIDQVGPNFTASFTHTKNSLFAKIEKELNEKSVHQAFSNYKLKK